VEVSSLMESCRATIDSRLNEVETLVASAATGKSGAGMVPAELATRLERIVRHRASQALAVGAAVVVDEGGSAAAAADGAPLAGTDADGLAAEDDDSDNDSLLNTLLRGRQP